MPWIGQTIGSGLGEIAGGLIGGLVGNQDAGRKAGRDIGGWAGGFLPFARGGMIPSDAKSASFGSRDFAAQRQQALGLSKGGVVPPPPVSGYSMGGKVEMPAKKKSKFRAGN